MKISIIGVSGSVGGPAAFYLATQKLADEFLLITRRENVAKQHAIDLGTAVAPLGVKVTSGGYEDMKGSDIIIITIGVKQGLIKDRMEMLPANALLMKDVADNIKKYCPNAVIITATNPADPMNYATYLAGDFDRKKVLGYTINDSFRFREFIAKANNIEVAKVGGYVIGEHGSSQVPLFSTVQIDGKPVPVTEETKNYIFTEIPLILKTLEELQAGRTAGWTCAIGFAQMVSAIQQEKDELIPCSIVLDGEYGQKGFSMSVPTILGKSGVRSVKEFKMADDEQQRFNVTVDVLSKAAKLVEDALK